MLVVENTETGHALMTALRQIGWHVVLYRTGMQALKSVREQPWDALVVGFRLLDIRGDAVVHAVNAEQPAMAARTLLLTTDDVGVEAADAAQCASLPTSTPIDVIVTRITQLIKNAS